jgi:hypothetical protein
MAASVRSRESVRQQVASVDIPGYIDIDHEFMVVQDHHFCIEVSIGAIGTLNRGAIPCPISRESYDFAAQMG